MESNTEAKRPPWRPTLYRDEFVQQMLDYFNIDRASEIQTGEDGKVTLSNKFPTLSGFAWKIGVTRETLHDWATSGKHEDFSYTYQKCKAAQEHILTTGALHGLYNASFAGLTAKNLCGWRDRQDLEHSGAGGGPMQFQEVVRRLVDPENPG